jgi:hypothetical protein
MFLGRREPTNALCNRHPMALDPQYVFGAVTLLHQPTEMKTEHVARDGRRLLCHPAEKNWEKSAHREGLSLDNGGPHKC